MITKYTSGTPIRTDAVVKDFAGIDINKFPVDYKSLTANSFLALICRTAT